VLERRPHVGRLDVEPLEPPALVRPAQLGLGPLGERQVVVAVALPHPLDLAGLGHAFQAVGRDGLQQPEPRLRRRG
jgi:hypothetical protein